MYRCEFVVFVKCLMLIEYRNFGLILNNFRQGRCKRTYELTPHFVTIKHDSVYILEE